MSAIAGIVHEADAACDPGEIAALIRFLGPAPDARGLLQGTGFIFTCAGLDTCEDRVGEIQPIRSESGLVIVADARIDAQAELRASLESMGRRLPAEARDADLILAAYETWGERCLDRLLGDFAFAIWDEKARRLFCARDHFGVKPFFHGSVRGKFIFSNSLRSVLAHPALPRDLDEDWIAEFLAFEMSLDPAATVYSAVRRLPPAHCLSWENGNASVRCYWQLPRFEIHHRSDREVLEGFEQVLRSAVSDRLRTRRVGVDMSGGLDSTAMAAMAKEVLAADGPDFDLRAYTVDYQGLFDDEEGRLAALVAQRLGMPHWRCPAGRMGLFEFAWGRDRMRAEPYHDPHASIGEACALEASRHGRVVLTGWDGDALMNESPKPYFRSLARRGDWLRLVRGAAAYARSERRWLPLAWQERLGLRPRWSGPYAPPAHPVWLSERLEAADLDERWRVHEARSAPVATHRPAATRALAFFQELSSFFDFYDPAVSGHSVEYRHPLLDLRVVRYCLEAPTWPWCVRKTLLRRCMRGRLPTEILERRKAPLAGFPYVSSLQKDEAGWVDSFRAAPALNQFVIRDKIPAVHGRTDPGEVWQNLMPLTLNLWLEGLDGAGNSTGTMNK